MRWTKHMGNELDDGCVGGDCERCFVLESRESGSCRVMKQGGRIRLCVGGGTAHK